MPHRARRQGARSGRLRRPVCPCCWSNHGGAGHRGRGRPHPAAATHGACLTGGETSSAGRHARAPEAPSGEFPLLFSSVIIMRHSRKRSADWRSSSTGSSLSRRDLWSGEGAQFRSWLNSSRKHNALIHAVFWVSIFVFLVVIYSYSSDLMALGRQLMQ